MQSPRDFFKPKAIGAPQPLREIPVKPSRMIHFFDPSNERMVAKVPEIAPQVDILLGNLEDAIPTERKIEAREGLVKIARNTDFGTTQLWTRVNSLDSPWFLDDMTRLVGEIGDRLEVIMIPKVEGPWDIHFVDQLLAQLEARNGLERPLLVHAILETAPRRVERRRDHPREPAHAGAEPGASRPRRVAAHEDDTHRGRAPRGTWSARTRTPTTPMPRGQLRSRTCGTTPWRVWWTPVTLREPCPSTGPLATLATPLPARTSSATPS